MSQKTFIGLSPDFSIVQSGQSVVYQSGNWVPANFLSANTSFYTQAEADGRFYSISGGTIYGGINATGYNVTASTFYGNLNWGYITNTPTTLAGYGITDAYTKTDADNKFVFKTGDTMTGQLFINVPGQQALIVSGNTVLTGNLYVSGTTTTIYTENMNVKDNTILINSGETGAGVSQLYAGIVVDRGTLTNYVFVFDETQDNFRIGETGSTQAVATREDNPINNSFAIWNNSQKRFDTSNNIIYSGNTLWLNNNIYVPGDVSANTFYGTFAGTITTDNLSLINLTSTTAWISNLNATNINFNGQNINDVFVNVNGDTMTGTLTVPLLTATTVSATTLHGNLDWSYIQNEPTTLAGYGITDAYTKTEADSKFVYKTGDTMTGELITPKVSATTLSAVTTYSEDIFVSDDLNVNGDTTLNTLALQSGVTVYGISDATGLTENSNSYLATQAAIKAYVDSKIASENYWTSTGSVLTPEIGYNSLNIPLYVTASTFYGNLNWSYITNTPTTIAGYGITDAYTKTETNNNFLSANTAYFATINANVGSKTATTPADSISIVGGNSITTNISGNVLTINVIESNFLSANTSFYTRSEADAKFVFKTGDTMTGELVIYRPGQQALTVAGDVNMTGNLYVSGTTTYVNTEDLNIKDNLITINSGETGAGVTKLFAGIRVDRGTLDSYVFLFDEIQDNFRIGMSNNPTGGTQAVATREDVPVNNALAIWNSSIFRFDTTNNLVYSGNTLWLSQNANISNNVTANTFYGSFVGNITTTDLNLSNLTATTAWISNLNATNINFNGQNINDVFVNVNGDTMTGNLTLPLLSATTVSATTLHGNLDWGYIQNKPNFDGLYYSISGGTIYGDVIPNTNGTRSLGSTNYMWKEVWVYDGIILRSPNGDKYKITVDSNGYLVSTPI